MKGKAFVCAIVLTLAAPFVAAQGNPATGGKQSGTPTRATGEQRQQYLACTQAADKVRDSARHMSGDGGARDFNSAEARGHLEQLQKEVRNMDELHARFMQGLTAEQRNSVQEHIRSLERVHEQLSTRLREMQKELGGPDIRGLRVQERARDIERAMKEWRKLHQRMAAELGV